MPASGRRRPPAQRPTVVVAVAAVLAAAPSAGALDRDRPLAQLHHTSWTAADGAPSQISAIAQTTDGFLWMGTARGLFRFDGVEFERFTPPNGASLPSHNVYALLATEGGGLWVSFRPSGLGYLANGTFTAYERPEELPRSHVYAFACDHEGRVWAGTHEGLALRDGDRWIDVAEEWNFPRERVRCLLVDRAGTLWVATDAALHRLSRGARSFEVAGPVDAIVPGMAEAPDGRVWFAATDSARPALAASDGSAGPVIRSTANAALFDRDGGLWIAAFMNGLDRVRTPDEVECEIARNDGRLESFGEADGLSGNVAYVLFEDREGSIWVGTAKGLDRFRHNSVVPVTLPAGHYSLTLLPGNDGEVWVGSATGKPLLLVRGGEAVVHDASFGVSSVYRDPGGAVWWGGFAAMLREQGGAFTGTIPGPRGPDDWMWEIVPGPAPGALWVSVGDVGLVAFENGEWTDRTPPAGLPDRGPSASFVAPDGRTWLGYTENRACVLEGGRVQCFGPDDGLAIGRVRVIRGLGPHVWFGGELGLAVFREGRFLTIESPLDEPFATISGIVETSDGSLWLNEMRGIVHVPAEEVRRMVEDPGSGVALRRFDYLDGVPGAGQMNWTCSTAIQGTDGRLWFATDNGLVWIDPRRLRTNDVPPPVAIRSLAAGERTYALHEGVALPQHTSSVRIDYTALSLVIPERVRFRYRLAGYDDAWIDAGTRRSAFYTGLGPGSYRFEVIASNNDGVWNESGAAAGFSIAPAFYETSWFLALCIVAAAGAVGIVFAVRMRGVAARLQRLHDERMDERTRIAHELHDTLLQGFLSASMQLHVAADAVPVESPAKVQLDKVLALMSKVIGEARDTVRGLRTDEGAPRDLEEAFFRIGEELGGTDTIEFRVDVTGRTRPVQPLVRDEIYRIGRESLLNAFRHADANRIHVELQYLPRELKLLVRDDGRGIDAEVLRSGREGHWGLTGMRERASRLGARLDVRSGPGSGTEVELSVPSRVAFAPEKRET